MSKPEDTAVEMTCMRPKYTFVSMGYRCSSAGILKRLGLKHASYPFDWMISRLPVIRHCIATNFVHFLHDAPNPHLYGMVETRTYDYSSTPELICDETILYNRYYMDFPMKEMHLPRPHKMPGDTYAYPLAMNHHNVNGETDHAYYMRCIGRFQTLFRGVDCAQSVTTQSATAQSVTTQSATPMYLYIHPTLSMTEYTQHWPFLLREYLSFQEFMERTYPQTRPIGMFILPVRTEHAYPITAHIETILCEKHNTLRSITEPRCVINVLYANRDFVDAGEIWMKNAYIETDTLCDYISGFV